MIFTEGQPEGRVNPKKVCIIAIFIAIKREAREFAHRLIEAGGVDIIHGHSPHHVKAIEVYCGKLILYGCGDFLDDYEGISGQKYFRSDLGLIISPSLTL